MKEKLFITMCTFEQSEKGMKFIMKTTALLTYIKIKHDLSKDESKGFGKLLFNKKNRINTKGIIEELMKESKPLLNAREYIQLSLQKDIDSINVKQEEISELLKISITFITLNDYRKLKEELKNTDTNSTSESVRISAIRNLLNICKYDLNIEEFTKLIEKSKNREIDFLAQKLYGRTETKFTDEALEAQKIMTKSYVRLKINEYKQILKDSYELIQSDFPDAYGNVVLIKSPKAELALEILKHTNIVISSFEEYSSLKENVKKIVENLFENIKQDKIDDLNTFSQYVLRQNLLFDFGYRQKITVKEIYYGTLEEQNDTMSKLLEEKDRFEYLYGSISLKSGNDFYD